jgi:hypothetical protein
MFLNNDIRVRKDYDCWTLPLIESASKGNLSGPTVGVLDSAFNFVCESNTLPKTGRVYMSGWNITASIDTWNKLIKSGEVGPFSTEFFAYFEDTDLSFRAKKLGIAFDVVSVPVHHFGRQTGRRVGIAPLYDKSRKQFLKLWGNK